MGSAWHWHLILYMYCIRFNSCCLLEPENSWIYQNKKLNQLALPSVSCTVLCCRLIIWIQVSLLLGCSPGIFYLPLVYSYLLYPISLPLFYPPSFTTIPFVLLPAPTSSITLPLIYTSLILTLSTTPFFYGTPALLKILFFLLEIPLSSVSLL